jgi:hypothetical protein
LATVAHVLAVSFPGGSRHTHDHIYPFRGNGVPAVVLRVSMLTEEELLELDDELLGVLGGVWATPARPVLLLQGRIHSSSPPGELNSKTTDGKNVARGNVRART